MQTKYVYAAVALLAMSLTSAVPAQAQDDPGYIPDEIKDGADDGTGWNPMLKASATVSLNHSHNVVGATNGLTFTGGFLLSGGLGYLSKNKQHEWRNSLNWGLSYTRTPTVPKFVKSIDSLDFETMYLWHTPKAPWFGPFVGLEVKSAVLPGYYVTPGDVMLSYTDTDGTTSSEALGALDSVDLTSAFAPLTLRESAGAFAVPIEKPEIRLEIRAGVGAMEAFVQDGYIIDDNADTPELELIQMQNSAQFGAEASLSAGGTIKEFMTYGARVAMLQPFVHNAETDLEGSELMNLDFEAQLGFKLTQWASLDYQFKAFRTPLVYDGWQVTNGLLLTFTANVVKTNAEKAAEAEALAAQEAEAQAEAEAAAAAAEAEAGAAAAAAEAAAAEAAAAEAAAAERAAAAEQAAAADGADGAAGAAGAEAAEAAGAAAEAAAGTETE